MSEAAFSSATTYLLRSDTVLFACSPHRHPLREAEKEVSVDNSRKTVENCVENCGKTSQLSTVIIPISGTVDNSHSYSHIILTTFHTFPLMPMQSINLLIINRLKTIYPHHFMSYPHFPQPIIIIKNILKVLKKEILLLCFVENF